MTTNGRDDVDGAPDVPGRPKTRAARRAERPLFRRQLTTTYSIGRRDERGEYASVLNWRSTPSTPPTPRGVDLNLCSGCARGPSESDLSQLSTVEILEDSGQPMCGPAKTLLQRVDSVQMRPH
jgi:hypothetical protein